MPFKILRHDEARYYGFGLRLGVANILKNGFRLGARKTVGKILQPINSYTRFPEYQFVERGLREHLERLNPARQIKALDVGSPKCMGLYLAYHLDIEIHLTDIYEPAVDEARILWRSIEGRARGKAVFSAQDARSLKYSQEEFDVVYSMSLIEHVGGEAGDSHSVREMLRVLKPGGILLVTVPLGQSYVEQERIGLEGAAQETQDGNKHFFQRIYTPAAAQERLLKAAPNAVLCRAVSVSRGTQLIPRLYAHLGQNARALLGCLNPILSTAWNSTREGISAVPGSYGSLYSERDLSGDLMLAWEKGNSQGLQCRI